MITAPAKLLIVARYREDVAWVSSELPGDWMARIYDKSGEDLCVPVVTQRRYLLNWPGREAHTYLSFIVAEYERIGQFDEFVFCQGNPFDHDREFLAKIGDSTVRFYGAISGCPSSGAPHMDGANLDDYCRVFGLPLQGEYVFAAGAQYRVSGQQIRQHPLAFYQSLLALTEINKTSAYSLERLWPIIWGIPLA